MAVKTHDSSAVLELLREPFDQEVIEEVDGFSNVKPHHYIQKVIDSGTPYRAYLVGAPTLHFVGDEPAVVTQGYGFEFPFGDTTYTVEGVGAEPVKDKFRALAFSFKSATSDAIKLALKPLGVGLDLYKEEVERPESDDTEDDSPPRRTSRPAQEEPEEEEKPARTSRSASSTRGSKTEYAWDGKKPFKFGKKHDGKVWADIPDSYLAWMSENVTDDSDYNKTTLKFLDQELARREETGESVADEPRAGAKQSQRRSGTRNVGKF